MSGSGAAGLKELETQIKAWSDGRSLKSEVYPHQIAFNLIPHVDSFEEDGYTREEMKMLHESKKIMEKELVMLKVIAKVVIVST